MSKRRRSEGHVLRLSPGLGLPIEAIVETFAVLGKRGAGKTATAVVMAEEMISAGHPAVVVDPVGVWWGLRSSADGKKDGLPVVIFGGDHADVPLTDKAGHIIADAIVSGRFPSILDLSHLSKSAMRRFMADFLERLYARNREPLHLIVDEADMLAPQRLPAEGLRLFGAMDDIQRRGRARGIGTTLITQRPAVINKDLLSQAEVLIALRLTGARDVAAIDEWVRLNADEDEAKLVKASLASLPVGTAWVWSPSLLGVLEKVPVRRRTTFDSSATPKPGQPRPVAEAFASIDTTALGAQIDSLTEEAAASDPKALRAKVARLEKDLVLAQGATGPPERVEVEKVVEVPVLTSEQEKVLAESTERIREYAANASTRAEQAVAQIHAEVERVSGMLDQLRAVVVQPSQATPSAPAGGSARDAGRSQTPHTSPPRRPHASGSPSGPAGDVDGVRLGKTERTILSVLAQHGPRTHDQLALLSGYSRKASTIGVALGRLRKAGLVADGRPITATDEGVAWLGDDVVPLPTGQALMDYWRGKFGLTEQRVLDAVISAYPHDTSQAEIAEKTGYSPTASTIGVALGRLRKVGVIDRWRLNGDFAAEAGISL